MYATDSYFIFANEHWRHTHIYVRLWYCRKQSKPTDMICMYNMYIRLWHCHKHISLTTDRHWTGALMDQFRLTVQVGVESHDKQIKIQIFSLRIMIIIFRIMRLKISLGKWRPFCPWGYEMPLRTTEMDEIWPSQCRIAFSIAIMTITVKPLV